MRQTAILALTALMLIAGCGPRAPGIVLDPRARFTEAPSIARKSTPQASATSDNDRHIAFSPHDCSKFRYRLDVREHDAEVPVELALFRKGNAAFQEGRADDAIDIWRSVIEDFPDTPASHVAILNVGGRLQSKGEYREAIQTYQILIPVDHEVREEPDSSDQSSFFEESDRHRACREISACYEELGDFADAARYARLARHTYKESEFCCVYSAWKENQLDERIALLEEQARNPEE